MSDGRVLVDLDGATQVRFVDQRMFGGLSLSVGGAVLVVKAVEASAVGTVYLLERASDGAQASVEVVGKGSRAVAYGVGTTVECSLVTGGVVLSVAGAVIAFVPDAIGTALLHNERL